MEAVRPSQSRHGDPAPRQSSRVPLSPPKTINGGAPWWGASPTCRASRWSGHLVIATHALQILRAEASGHTLTVRADRLAAFGIIMFFTAVDQLGNDLGQIGANLQDYSDCISESEGSTKGTSASQRRSAPSSTSRSDGGISIRPAAGNSLDRPSLRRLTGPARAPHRPAVFVVRQPPVLVTLPALRGSNPWNGQSLPHR